MTSEDPDNAARNSASIYQLHLHRPRRLREEMREFNDVAARWKRMRETDDAA